MFKKIKFTLNDWELNECFWKNFERFGKKIEIEMDE